MSAASGEVDTRLREALARTRTLEKRGRVVQAFGTTIHASGLDVRIGQGVEIVDPVSGARLPAEVIGLSAGLAILTPLRPLTGLSSEAEVIAGPARSEVMVGPGLLGRVIDAHGEPLDGKGEIKGPLVAQPVYAEAPNPLERTPISEPFPTGVRVIDTLLTLGRGQRMGVFAAAGGGKSTLLGMLARHCEAQVNVIALIGERGREVREFLEDALGEEGLARSVVVVSTSDRPAMERVRAAHAACAVAEYFRDASNPDGSGVLLMMDSVTRFARALREVGLSVGEPAVRRGFPPSVFAELPRLFERAGPAAKGAITAIYTVLLEDEDATDPVGEEVRSILDGHIVLSRKLGEAGRYPAVDLLASLSRLYPRVTDAGQRASATKVRAWLAKYAEIEFMLQIGEYKPGGDALADEAIARQAALERLLRQAPEDGEPFASGAPEADGDGLVSADAARRLTALTRIERLRERRVRAAELELIQLRAERDRRAEALAACERAIARIDIDRAALDSWFDRAPEPRHIQSALARRDALARARLEAMAELDAAATALESAEAERADAARRLARLKARLDVVSGQLAAARRVDGVRREGLAEIEQEERLGPGSRLPLERAFA